jgi:uncharacterized protein with NAD-binding domain and iron-sulfur cluster
MHLHYARLHAANLQREIDTDYVPPVHNESGEVILGSGLSINPLQDMLDKFLDWFYAQIKTVSTDLRHLKLLIEMAHYHIKGILDDGVLFKPNGLESLNGEEYTAWLKRHGAPDELLNCALITGMYDMAFCYTNGNPVYANRSVAAGTSVYGLLRMFLTYQGAVYFKMNAGMGDTVFAPLYAVLKARGVKFKFFHRVTNIHLTDDKKEIASIEMAQQVDSKDPDYDPLVFVKNMPCWPDEPVYDRIVQGQQLEDLKNQGVNVDLESYWTAWQDVGSVTLNAIQDFDKVVLGISLGALPYICPELITASTDWQAMIDNIPTVWTRQYELWLTKTSADLGTTQTKPLAMAYDEPGDVWTEMSHLLPVENWQGDQVPQSLFYIGSVMPTPTTTPPPSQHDYPQQAKQQAFDAMATYLQKDAKLIWPAGTTPENPNGLDWNLLYAADGSTGQDRLWAQDVKANINPTERHPIAKEGSYIFRLRQGDSKFKRLYLTGDWTYTGVLSFGCVEGAAMAGILCAQAVSGVSSRVIGF